MLAAIIVIAALGIAVAFLVFQTGGTRLVYSHLAYVPILLGAASLGWKGGVGSGLYLGILLGPFMPLDSVGDIPQTQLGWMLRTAFFVAIGGLAGGLFDWMRRLMEEDLRREFWDSGVDLPNFHFAEMLLDSPEKRQYFSSVLVISINACREVRASFGNQMADELLFAAGQRARAAVPETSVLFRNSVNQFGIISDDPDIPELLGKVAAELREAVTVNGIPILMDPTVGGTSLDDGTREASRLIRQASMAAENAWDRGAHFEIYQKVVEDKVRERIRLVADLQGAIETDQLSLLYQPKVRISDGEMIGCEALVRWEHPSRGLILPGEFMPYAERSGLATELAARVLSEALDAAQYWNFGGKSLPLSINMSPRDLSDRKLVDRTIDEIRQASIDPGMMEIEVTESAAISTDCIRHLHMIRDAGISLAIDDYGTGLSSLTHLREIPASALKIDQSFVKDIHEDRSLRILVESTVKLCRQLGIETVAEGVENEAEFAILREIGCDAAQGYLIAKPLARTQIQAILLRPGPQFGFLSKASVQRSGVT